MVEYGKSELDHITGRDPVMKTLAERFGYLEKGMTEDVFVALVESIVGQMLSNKAAGTLCGRLKNIVGEFTPAALAAHSAEEIKSCGISRSVSLPWRRIRWRGSMTSRRWKRCPTKK